MAEVYENALAKIAALEVERDRLREALAVLDPIYYDGWNCRLCDGPGDCGDTPTIEHRPYCEYESIKAQIAKVLAKSAAPKGADR